MMVSIRLIAAAALVILAVGCQPRLHGPDYDPCADYPRGPEKESRPPAVEPLAARVNDGLHETRARHLLILLDDTLSMQDCLEGTSKRRAAIDLVARMNRSLDGLPLAKGLRVFSVNADRDDLSHDLGYAISRQPNRQINPYVINNTPRDTIFNPVAMALDSAYMELKGMRGGTAVVIVSDFTHTGEPLLESAGMIRRKYGNSVCLYPVLIGADDEGRATAEEAVRLAGCGMVEDRAGLQEAARLTDFLEGALFSKVEPPAPLPPFAKPSYEALVREKELRVDLRIQFDFDKAEIKPEYIPHLRTIADFMREHPDVSTVIEGHTCDMGTVKYNLKLSLRRAMAIKEYLTGRFGIDPSRLQVAAFGESRPIADNSTEEGRIKNRRAVAVLRAVVPAGDEGTGR